MTLRELGTVQCEQQDYDRAARNLASAEELNRKIGNQIGLANTFQEQGVLLAAKSDPAGARDRLMRALELFRNYGIKRDEEYLLEKLRSLGLLDEDDNDEAN